MLSLKKSLNESFVFRPEPGTARAIV